MRGVTARVAGYSIQIRVYSWFKFSVKSTGFVRMKVFRSLKFKVVLTASPFFFPIRDCTKDIFENPRELNQAVTFLHENGESLHSMKLFSFNETVLGTKRPHVPAPLSPGIMLHYATPALNHLYFVDPQWLCDMLAHIVTVPEVNRFIQRNDGEGVWW